MVEVGFGHVGELEGVDEFVQALEGLGEKLLLGYVDDVQHSHQAVVMHGH